MDYERAIIVSIFVYLAMLGGLMVAHDGFISPDQFFILALAGVVVADRQESFLRDWTPPILLLLGYDSLRGVLPHLIARVHVLPMIRFDERLFGQTPTIWLQQRFFSGRVHWYDSAAVILYFLHFFVPLLLALAFWLQDRPLFRRYMTAMVVVSYLAFITYYVYPAMPPWMASAQGYLPHVAPIMRKVLAGFAQPVSLPSLYRYLGVNPVAAVPSLHAAFPLMMALFLRKKFARWGWLAFAYPAAVWIAIVYLGEHYVFDIVAAVVYTLAVYALVTNWERIRFRRFAFAAR